MHVEHRSCVLVTVSCALCACLLLLQLREAAAQSSDLQREVGLLRQALADKERQLAVLLAETERLQGRPVSSSSSSSGGGSSSSSSSGISSSGVTL
jgi:uncharacterized membrane protein YgcG